MKKELFICVGGSLINSLNIAVAQEKPNFLFILTDDQTYESIYSVNNKEVHTPNLDRLVKNGTVFTHAFNQGSWTGAVSVASRTMLITGQNVVNSQKNSAYIVDWARTVPLEEGTEAELWGDVMGKAGYTTFITGKWHNTDAPLLKSFQNGEAIVDGFYETYDSEGKSDFGYNRPNDKGWNAWDTTLKGHWSPAVRNIIYEHEEKNLLLGR
ncbi:MAG: sulfatase-like hydrolase/transferase [Odoribacter sp.]|nr:sulfatase-like hydrolase/transferase [Odoribacter sp.]